MDKMNYLPWIEEYRSDDPATADEILLIKEPPCSHCAWWNPRRVFVTHNGKTFYTGVSLCDADYDDGMNGEFTCFAPREEE